MTIAAQVDTTVLPGNRIEISVPELAPGQRARVLVLTDEGAASPKRDLSDILAGYPGGQLFRTSAEVDAYLKAEREAWDR